MDIKVVMNPQHNLFESDTKDNFKYSYTCLATENQTATFMS